jgi:Protein  of unknown function (DUF3018)
MNDLSTAHQDKFRAYRARKRAAGFKEIWRWVWDVNSPAFKAQAAREAEILNGVPEEEEATRFIEALQAEDPETWY